MLDSYWVDAEEAAAATRTTVPKMMAVIAAKNFETYTHQATGTHFIACRELVKIREMLASRKTKRRSDPHGGIPSFR